MGQKLRYGRPCTRDLPCTHNWLAQSHITFISSDSNDYLMLAQSCKFGVNCCFIGLTHPAACTRAHVPLTFGHVHRPPLTQFAQKGCKSTGLEGISMVYLIFVGVAQSRSGDPPKTKTPPRDHPTPTLPDSTHIYTN